LVRVLIAEDELRLADAIARGLRRQGFAVDLAPDGEQALVKSRVVRYDVLVLDRDLPGTHGDQVAETVAREHPEVRILMLTAARSIDEVVDLSRHAAQVRSLHRSVEIDHRSNVVMRNRS